MSITIGQDELANTLKYLGYVNPKTLAQHLIHTAEGIRVTAQEKADAEAARALPSWAKPPVESITQAELAEALNRLKYTGAVHAERIFENVMTNREPLWSALDVVRDARSVIWQFQNSAFSQPWQRVGSAAYAAFDVPVRPLTRLTEEK